MTDYTSPDYDGSDLSADELLANMELFMARESEYQAEVAAAGSDSFAVYWAGSASASVLRDYKAGRVITIKSGRR